MVFSQFLCCKLFPDVSCTDESSSISHSAETVDTTSANNSTNVDTHSVNEASEADQQHIEQSKTADRQDEATASSWSWGTVTSSGSAFYCHPVTNCYESFSCVVKNANKTSNLSTNTFRVLFVSVIIHSYYLRHSRGLVRPFCLFIHYPSLNSFVRRIIQISFKLIMMKFSELVHT